MNRIFCILMCFFYNYSYRNMLFIYIISIIQQIYEVIIASRISSMELWVFCNSGKKKVSYGYIRQQDLPDPQICLNTLWRNIDINSIKHSRILSKDKVAQLVGFQTNDSWQVGSTLNAATTPALVFWRQNLMILLIIVKKCILDDQKCVIFQKYIELLFSVASWRF